MQLTLNAPKLDAGLVEFAEFDWLQSLADCPQDPRYHAEGIVLTDTRLICEALISLPAWRELSLTERSLVFATALLHEFI